jgi:uncharacterized protein (DUF2267 family)
LQVFERFITLVRIGTGLDRRGADRAAEAVLTTLFERIAGGQADDVVQQLKPPDGFIPGVLTLGNRPADRFDLHEFLHRVADREGVDEDTARKHTTTVLNALRVVVPGKEWADTVAQLPKEFERLLAEQWRPRQPVVSRVAFLELVRERTGWSSDEAGQVTDAVLEGLAEVLPDGDVNELIRRLPDEMRGPLERGMALRTAPRRLDLQDFLQLLAERMGSDPQTARERGRVVLQVLVAALDDQMVEQLLVQFPDDYVELLVPELAHA